MSADISLKSPGSPAPRIPLSRLLSQMGVELKRAAATLADIELAVGLVVTAAGRADARMLVELQAIDHLHQTLQALAEFASDIAADAPEDWQIDVDGVARSLKLDALAKRLALAPAGATTDRHVAMSDLEIFD